jgi:fructose-1-phosphate kinase PfkB-like protein
MPPHLYTLTGNLLAERTLEFAAWSPGRTQRAKAESFQVGGKGINVSKMLNRLGAANTALCFTGGTPGAECEAWLRQRGFAFRAFASKTATRCGTVVRDASGAQLETTFLGPDAAPDAAAVRACAEFLDAQPAGHVLALCGSFPGWAGGDFEPLRAALLRWLERGVLVADSYGPPLTWLSGHALALVKINATEFRSLQPTGEIDFNAGPKVRRWIVTDGPQPVRLRDADGATATLIPPAVREVSATGSGDVLLACVLEALFVRGTTLRDAVAYALPYAAANAAHPGVAEFPTQELRR